MIDHVSLRVSDFGRALSFYKAALAPLGYTLKMEFPGYAGFHSGGAIPDFWVTESKNAINAAHIAFSGDRKAVDAFFSAATAAGGTDDGPPGLRLNYTPNYYAAFVRDPDGNSVEAVCHVAPGEAGTKRAAAKKPAAKKAPAKKAPQRKPAAKKPASKKPAQKPAQKPTRKAPARKPAKKVAKKSPRR